MANEEFTVSKFLSNFAQGGALQSLFQAKIKNGPTGIIIPDSNRFMIKTTSFPESVITAGDIAYMGRSITIPGNRESQQWSTEIYNDEDHKIRMALLKWMDNINAHADNVREDNWIGLSQYTGTLDISQLSKTGAKKATAVATFYRAWPSTVGEISLDWETNEIQTYEVTWEFSHWSMANDSGTKVGITGGGPAGSDYRLKNDIVLIRKATSTMPNLYMFKYKWDKVTNYIGVMAQELLDTGFKDAAIKNSNGFYSVDYKKLGFPMLRLGR